MNTNNTPAPPILPWHREAAKEIDDNPFTQEAAELAAIIARHDPHAAQEDKERLDWLSDNPIHDIGFGQAPGTIRFNGEVHWSLRAAIDAARSQPTP